MSVIAVVGPQKDWADVLVDELRADGMKVIHEHGSGTDQVFNKVIVTLSFSWSPISRIRKSRFRELFCQLEDLEGHLRQRSDVLILIQLIDVPANKRRGVLPDLEEIAVGTESDVRNFAGRDCSVNIIAFEDPAELITVAVALGHEILRGFAGVSGVAVHLDEVRNGRLREALIASIL